MGEQLSDSGNSLIRPGGNNPPPDAFKDTAAFQALVAKIDGLYQEAKNWADGSAIDSEAMHDEIARLFNMLGEAGAEAEAMRVALNEPFLAGTRAVQAAFNPLNGDTKAGGKGLVVRAREALGALLSVWRVKVQEARDKAAREAAAAAELEKAEAARLIQSSAGNLEAREEAEAVLKDANKAVKTASREVKAANTKTGLRISWRPAITDLNKALGHYYAGGNSPHRAEFEELVARLARSDIGQGKRDAEDGTPAIPGIRIEQEKTAK